MKRYVDNAKKQVSAEDAKSFLKYRFNLSTFLFDKQLAFVEDPLPFKAAVCSRRSGKTVSCAAHLIHTALNTNDCVCLYITLTRDNARKLVWKELKNINKLHNLDADINESDLSMEFKNGSIIYASGAKDYTEIEKFRGLAIKLCYIDECQSFREYIKELIDDIIAPALIDYAGSLVLIGTPSPTPTGYFYECAVKSDAWSKHSWTFWDNPHIQIKSGKTHQEILERELKRRGITVDNPSIQREFFGKWALDLDSLLLQYRMENNDYEELPDQKYNYILGIDIGYKDADALAVLAWSEKDPTTYLVEEIITTKQGITELVDQIQGVRKKYDISKIVMDFGGLGKKIGEEMSRRYLIPVEPAEKTRKMENIALLNDAMRTKKFKAKKTSRFAQDSYLIEIDRDKSTPERIAVSNRFHSDIADAVLYAFKFSPAYGYEPPPTKPERGTQEWAKHEENQMFEAELAGLLADLEYKKEYGGY